MNMSKRHHFVPQMLLRRFKASNGRLFAFNKGARKNGIFSTTTENLFVKKHLYTEYNKIGERDDWLERKYSKIEGAANNVIEKIVTAIHSGTVPNLTTSEKATWNKFFYYQWKRVPDFADGLGIFSDFDTKIDQGIEKFEQKIRPMTKKEKGELQQNDVRERIKQSAKLKALADPGSVVQNVLRNKGIGIAKITKPNKSFIIGSQPVVKLTHPRRANLDDPTVSVWLPISPDIAVSPTQASKTISVVQANDQDIRAINEAIYKQSTIIAGRSAALIKSLAGIR